MLSFNSLVCYMIGSSGACAFVRSSATSYSPRRVFSALVYTASKSFLCVVRDSQPLPQRHERVHRHHGSPPGTLERICRRDPTIGFLAHTNAENDTSLYRTSERRNFYETSFFLRFQEQFARLRASRYACYVDTFEEFPQWRSMLFHFFGCSVC